MSTLINLLPDLRQAKLRERRRRQLVSGVSVTIWIVCGAVVALMSIIAAGQKVSISNHTKAITQGKTDLENVAGLLDALTAEEHLKALPALYDQRVYLTKFFKAYSEASPVSTTISSLSADNQNVLTVRGVAPTYAEVAKLARALIGSNVTVGSSALASNSPYFSDVTIQSVDSGDKTGVNFTIKATMGSGVTSGSN
ncbi:MAG TPA: PilN domain-containing protein [Candidatus Saccharimonadia bacterium]|nr:PilN domain-containing protein [Candidatus Saccharimonadia bacterium]